MRPEARDYLAKAEEDLADARKILEIGLAKAAARSAYYAAFHAAEALLFERTGRIAKTHSGLRTALAQALDRRSDADRALLTFLARAYKYKELSDYAVGRAAVVTQADASDLIQAATRLLVTINERLGSLDEN